MTQLYNLKKYDRIIIDATTDKKNGDGFNIDSVLSAAFLRTVDPCLEIFILTNKNKHLFVKMPFSLYLGFDNLSIFGHEISKKSMPDIVEVHSYFSFSSGLNKISFFYENYIRNFIEYRKHCEDSPSFPFSVEYEFFKILDSFRPNFYLEKDMSKALIKAYEEACDFTYKVFTNLIKRENNILAISNDIYNQISTENNDGIIISKFYSENYIKCVTLYSDAKFLIMPKDDDKFVLIAIQDDNGKVRVPIYYHGDEKEKELIDVFTINDYHTTPKDEDDEMIHQLHTYIDRHLLILLAKRLINEIEEKKESEKEE